MTSNLINAPAASPGYLYHFAHSYEATNQALWTTHDTIESPFPPTPLSTRMHIYFALPSQNNSFQHRPDVESSRLFKEHHFNIPVGLGPQASLSSTTPAVLQSADLTFVSFHTLFSCFRMCFFCHIYSSLTPVSSQAANPLRLFLPQFATSIIKPDNSDIVTLAISALHGITDMVQVALEDFTL